MRHWVFPGNTVDVTTIEQVKTDLRGWQRGALPVRRRCRQHDAFQRYVNSKCQSRAIVSYVKLSEATGGRNFVLQALQIAQDMQQRGVLAPRDAWMIDDLKRRAGQ